jgi:hypothetical protein
MFNQGKGVADHEGSTLLLASRIHDPTSLLLLLKRTSTANTRGACCLPII